jgi:iron complex outermembrane receptor protein
LKTVALVSCSIVALALSAPAIAQDEAGEAEAESGSGDIIVTARRTEERLQDVPISITVFNQEAIDNRTIGRRLLCRGCRSPLRRGNAVR